MRILICNIQSIFFSSRSYWSLLATPFFFLTLCLLKNNGIVGAISRSILENRPGNGWISQEVLLIFLPHSLFRGGGFPGGTFGLLEYLFSFKSWKLIWADLAMLIGFLKACWRPRGGEGGAETPVPKEEINWSVQGNAPRNLISCECI